LSPEFREAVDQLHRLGSSSGSDGGSSGGSGDSLPVAPDLRAIAERRPQFIPDVQSEAALVGFSDTARKLGFRSMLSVPLIPHDEPIGALSLFFTRRSRLDRQQRQLMDTVSSTVAVAVQRALLQDNLVRQEAERLALIESSRLKTEFISTVSHELRTPLASIEGYVQLILRGHAGDVPPLQLEFLQTVGRNSRRLCSLVDDLLDISRIEAGTLLLERDPVDLGAVISECVDMISSQAEDRNMAIVLDVAPELPQVMGDFQRIGEILTNFLSNAVKYGKPGTPIHIRAAPSDSPDVNEVIVSVKDEGIGLTPEELPKLFRKFYRVDNSTTRTQGGTGLGLAIAKHLVELHGGRVWVESEPDRGSTFFFALPAIHGA
ncbi:MAG: HAMP domain-containing histidine kinase, partial [Chloroflexi bacterium]|nr:HAMP domain-containing histidine kinase [Chloroflexota bacterium]